MADPRVLGIVLAGGAGTRLAPLTDDRAKPAVPFGGVYRLVDFALSNLANSGIRKICVLTQYKSHSLDRHISTTWRMSDLLGNYVTPVPAQQRLGPHWYTGSADAIHQSMNLINDENPELVVVFGADHVYRMDPRQMIAQHLEYGAGVTVAAIPVARQDAKDFGVLAVAKDGRTIDRFLEKPANPPPMPGSPEESYASMGIYVFGRKELVDALERDAADDQSRHDIGGNIVPMMVADGSRARLRLPHQLGAGRDRTGRRLLAGRRHHRRLLRLAHGPAHRRADVQPLQRELADPHPHVPAAAGQVRPRQRRPGGPRDRLAGLQRRDRLRRSGPGLGAFARRARQQLGDRGPRGAAAQRRGGPDAEIRNAIIDKNVIVPEGAKIGVDKEHDLARGFLVSAGGITVVAKGQAVPL